MSFRSYSLSKKTLYSFTVLPSSSCTCVLSRQLSTLSYVTWRIFHSDTFPHFIPSPFSFIQYTKFLSGFAVPHPGQRRVALLVIIIKNLHCAETKYSTGPCDWYILLCWYPIMTYFKWQLPYPYGLCDPVRIYGKKMIYDMTDSFTNSLLTHSITHSLTRSLTHSLTHSITHWLSDSLIYSI